MLTDSILLESDDKKVTFQSNRADVCSVSGSFRLLNQSGIKTLMPVKTAFDGSFQAKYLFSSKKRLIQR